MSFIAFIAFASVSKLSVEHLLISDHSIRFKLLDRQGRQPVRGCRLIPRVGSKFRTAS